MPPEPVSLHGRVRRWVNDHRTSGHSSGPTTDSGEPCVAMSRDALEARAGAATRPRAEPARRRRRIVQHMAHEPADRAATGLDPISCPRCDRALQYVGRKRFHEGTNWGFFGELGEFFVKREHFDLYVCPRCGRVEFFVDGVGEEHRPQ